MVTYVLDASAILRSLDDEAGTARVAEIIKAHLTGSGRAIISALYWGEIAGVSCKLRGQPAMDMALACLEALGLGVVPAISERATRAALIKRNRKIPYVDAFGVELAASSSGQVLVTADFDLKPASKDVKIEFLPSK
jgi:predicted nucleic acid-binding protein